MLLLVLLKKTIEVKLKVVLLFTRNLLAIKRDSFPRGEGDIAHICIFES